MGSSPATNELTISEARQLLRDKGLRATTCRIAVLGHLAAASHPLTHSDVADALADRGMDNSTIYRSLVEFSEIGLATRFDLGDHTWRFEMIRQTEGETDEHPHFVCNDCGKVACMPGVEVSIKRKSGKKSNVGRVTDVLLKGQCTECG